MTEDEIYRTSTQYRLWSFTPHALASLRSTTNELAVEGVKSAIKSQRAEARGEGVEDGERAKARSASPEIDCLTVEEEQRLVGYYCLKTMEFANFCDFPTNVMVLHSSKLRSKNALEVRLTPENRPPQCNISSASTSPIPP